MTVFLSQCLTTETRSSSTASVNSVYIIKFSECLDATHVINEILSKYVKSYNRKSFIFICNLNFNSYCNVYDFFKVLYPLHSK